MARYWATQSPNAGSGEFTLLEMLTLVCQQQAEVKTSGYADSHRRWEDYGSIPTPVQVTSDQRTTSVYLLLC